MKKPEGARGIGVRLGEILLSAEADHVKGDASYLGFLLNAAKDKLEAIDKVLKAKMPDPDKLRVIKEILDREEWV